MACVPSHHSGGVRHVLLLRSHADQGQDFYEPSPKGSCFALPDSVSDKEAKAKAEADFINYHNQYGLIPVNDSLAIFTACNKNEARCYRTRIVCDGKQVYEVWFWREIQKKERKRK